jgi:hypothetical protein
VCRGTVLDWVRKEYHITGEIVRPFWPDLDYLKFDYPPGCVVVDNPPFSIVAKIVRAFSKNGIRFFLFAPYLTLFGLLFAARATVIITSSDVTYENGARVKTSFVTNLNDPDTIARTAPDLANAIRDANKRPEKAMAKLEFPPNLVNAARFSRDFCRNVDFEIRRDECELVRNFGGRKIFGVGLVLSDTATARLETARLETARQTIRLGDAVDGGLFRQESGSEGA